MMLFYFLMPTITLIFLGIIGYITYTFGIIKRAKTQGKGKEWITWNTEKMRTNLIRIALLFCLTIFPIITSEYLLYFDCRDFGSYGNYLRRDYSVKCHTNRYNTNIYLALCGIFLFGVGIPVFFYNVVKYRDQPIFTNSSIVLHRSFKTNYKQFEIVALFHKVLLFSIVYFVATPGTSSQCLFLLLCNMGYFMILALCQPYAFFSDTILALSLTCIECFAFLIAFLVISGVSDVEAYDMDELYNAFYGSIIVAICFLFPVTYAIKYERVNAAVWRKTGFAVNKLKAMTRRSSRRSSSMLRAWRQRATTYGEGGGGENVSSLQDDFASARISLELPNTASDDVPLPP
jgi:hypothetical protein